MSIYGRVSGRERERETEFSKVALRTILIRVEQAALHVTFLAQFVTSCRAPSGALPARSQLQTPARGI